jgi:predicted DCC family thiol-disulfide oxidoreductase YuxK
MNPVLLYNDECAVCRVIGKWVKASAGKAPAGTAPEQPVLIVRPIGDDPAALLALNSQLDIWDAYETIHLVMPDGTMKCGGEAVAEVFRTLPNTRWFAGSFTWSVFGFRPCQALLNAGYTLLSDVRPLLGCESCGMPNVLVKTLHGALESAMIAIGATHKPKRAAHFTRSARPL